MTAFIICSRLSSSRVPNKCLVKYNEVTQIEHLISRLTSTGLPIYLCVPGSDAIHYSFLLSKFPRSLNIFTGHEDDPLARTHACAKAHGVTSIIRVTHDKIFVDTDKLQEMLRTQLERKADYVYSSDFIPGTQFEIISFDALSKAVEKFRRVEHISYAIKAVTNNSINYRFNVKHKEMRLLIDYPEDVKLMQLLFATLGTDCTLKDAVSFLYKNGFARSINKLPLVTVYTCALNAQRWIDVCADSVASQDGFSNFEYLLIDDHSTDKTLFKMAKFCDRHENARFVRNEKNYGLASSSNIALKMARGKYIVRLDADDFFVKRDAIKKMVAHLEEKKLDVVYPNCYLGLSKRFIQKGNEKHHVGGTLFRTSAINHIKFTDNLRNHDSLDVFLKAKDQLKIGYINDVTFCYRQHNRSMSKSNLAEREVTRRIIESKYLTKATI